MAILNEAVVRKTPAYSGAFGTLSAIPFSYTFAAAQIADIAILAQIPQGARVVGIIPTNAALGSGVTLTFGYRQKDPSGSLAAAPTAFGSISNANTPATTMTVFPMVKNTVETFLTATVGGAAATGALSGVLLYSFEGA